ncbi:hypothetical protein VKT23_006015 [Stygiomarasmius scandens]|uniref:Maturase K n=1 Tax=Marasmiellus scandens TaxID=2682957 RepID=A0ABR1JRK8_9AGAR
MTICNSSSALLLLDLSSRIETDIVFVFETDIFDRPGISLDLSRLKSVVFHVNGFPVSLYRSPSRPGSLFLFRNTTTSDIDFPEIKSFFSCPSSLNLGFLRLLILRLRQHLFRSSSFF